jgi:hypothetical protein
VRSLYILDKIGRSNQFLFCYRVSGFDIQILSWQFNAAEIAVVADVDAVGIMCVKLFEG